jgi:hypothetical protein
MDPQDNLLSFEEFAVFRHPEQSNTMLEKMVQEIIDNLGESLLMSYPVSLTIFLSDQDNNDEITLEEFVALNPGEVEYAMHGADVEWKKEREKEFKEIIDLNVDGRLTKDELKV